MKNVCRLALLFSAPVFAAQWGPVFPTHDFPTDRSFLFNANVDYGTESSIFNENGKREKLPGSLNRIRFTLNPEYQPSRRLSLGAYLNIDSLTAVGTDPTTNEDLKMTKGGLSDQFLFGEYRMIDETGYSIGFAAVFKIPAYSAPKQVTSTSAPFLILGDGQIDGTLLGTSEYWPAPNVKLYGDLGFTYRADDFASEVPFQLGADYVSQKFSVGIDLLGEVSLRNDKTDDTDIAQNIHDLNGGTNYVFAKNPTLFVLMLKGEYAFNYEWAARAHFENSISGRNAPYFFNGGIGVSYRFYDPQVRARTAREVGIDTDDSSDVFEGEMQEDNQQKDIQDFKDNEEQ